MPAGNLSAECIYTIKHERELRRVVEDGSPHIEGKWWSQGSQLFERARASDERMPILFADAAYGDQLLGWALLDRIEKLKHGTAAHFSAFVPFECGRKQELVLLGTGEPIKSGFIRPYALCKTPWFLSYQRRREPVPRPARAWVVKGQSARNDFPEMLSVVHGRGGWVTKRPPGDWAVDDFVFLWASAPELRIIGLARIAALPQATTAEDETRFELEYLTGVLSHGPDLTSLRQHSGLSNAAFLKSGPAATVFPLTAEQSEVLATLVTGGNPSCTPVVEDHLLGVQRATPRIGERDEAPFDLEELAFFEAREGSRVLRLHQIRERDSTLRRRAKDLYRERTGGLACTVCDFDFEARYGKIGADFAEVHHAVPLSSYEEDGAITDVRALVVVCANCHRMLHRRRPWLVVEDVKRLLASDF